MSNQYSGLIQRLHEVVGNAGIVTEENAKLVYETDWLKKWTGRSSLVVRPATTGETAKVVRICHETRTPIVTQGGNTGMSGGATPDSSGAQVVLSTVRMNAIREVNLPNNTLTAEAGALLAHIQSAALEVDRFFPLSLGSEGSCTIGGNLATNAGGVAVLRYGNTRELTLGLEVVLPDGRVWNGMRGLRKDNTGYDLRDLFIGSEGTLGVITAAVLKLHPRPLARATAWVGARSMEAMVRLLASLRAHCGERLAALEMISEESMQLILDHVSDVRNPLAGAHRLHALVELTDMQEAGLRELLEYSLGEALEEGVIQDVVVSVSGAQTQAFWKIREAISQAQVRAGKAVKHDIALPISAIADFVERADAAVRKAVPQAKVISFGHLGDGNLHYNLLLPLTSSAELLACTTASANRIVHDIVCEFNGSISAEHGVGQLRRDEIRHYKSDVELDLMMRIKRSIDPNHIMNPGKLI